MGSIIDKGIERVYGSGEEETVECEYKFKGKKLRFYLYR